MRTIQYGTPNCRPLEAGRSKLSISCLAVRNQLFIISILFKTLINITSTYHKKIEFQLLVAKDYALVVVDFLGANGPLVGNPVGGDFLGGGEDLPTVGELLTGGDDPPTGVDAFGPFGPFGPLVVVVWQSVMATHPRRRITTQAFMVKVGLCLKS